MFGVMWSEHCAYKHSKAALRRFPSRGRGLLRGPGENAGAVSVGDGWAAVFKMESHNHPSAVAPFHGAATGVGGIIRDILAMGARPMALLDSLRFGPPDDRAVAPILHGVIAGISAYGNSIGVPTVGGELACAPCYRRNPLVNVACLGLGARGPDRHVSGVRARATRSCTWARGPGATACTARRSRRPSSRATRRTARRCRWAIRSRASS